MHQSETPANMTAPTDAGNGRSAVRDLRIGIDVGGTNTDAVIMDQTNAVIAWTKQPTTRDVTGGMNAALSAVLEKIPGQQGRVGRVMLGTTHATNAILERRNLGRVAVVRIGAPATTAVPPLDNWPADLRRTVEADHIVIRGGHFIDGYPIAPLDVDEARRFFGKVAGSIDAVAITGVFSPAFPDQERAIAEIAAQELGSDAVVSMSHEIGSLGLVERENATVLNAALYRVAREVTGALESVLQQRGLDATPFFAQNDGTLMALEYAASYPVLTIGSGPANSIRGAAFLSGLDNAVVADVGGTSTDLGVLTNGYPRESAVAVEIGGVRTNFRMPDILSLAIGGGTKISGTPDEPRIGPESVGYRVDTEALVFGGQTATLTDAAVAGGRTTLGTTPVDGWSADRRALLGAALADVDARLDDAADRMSLGKADRPLVAVGGGGFLIPDRVPGVTEVLRPAHSAVANAVGAVIALASGRWDAIIPVGAGRKSAIDAACQTAITRAIEAGAEPDKVEIVEMTEIPLSYLTDPSTRIHVKAAGPLGLL